MNVPKQSMPVMRILPSVSYSSQLGVNPSIKLVDMLKRLFNSPNPSPGTCTCRDGTGSADFGVERFPSIDSCNPGFWSQCDMNGGCTCVTRRTSALGKAVRPFTNADFETFSKDFIRAI